MRIAAMRLVFALAISCFALQGTARNAAAQDWTRFRGPNGAGISEAKTIPVEWTMDDYLWRTKLPGAGHSSPVLWGKKIFLTSGDDTNAMRYVMCLNADDGKILWTKSFDSSIHRKHGKNSFASSTPVVDAERLYVTWTSPDEVTMLAFDHDGNQVWKKMLGPYISQHSGGVSPIIYKDMVILGNEQDKGDNAGPGISFVVALDAKTGETKWKTSRNSVLVAYSTPCVYRGPSGKDELIFNSKAHGIYSLNPENGSVNWEFNGLFDKRSISSPVLAAGHLIGSCGDGAGTRNYLVAIDPGQPEKNIEPKLAYKIDKASPYVPTPIAKDDLLFLWGDNGIVSCLDAATGNVHWRQRIGGGFSGSPIWIDGKIYCMSEDGNCVVLAAAKEFKELAKNPTGELSHSTPSVSNGVLYLRTRSHLMAIRNK